MRLLGVGYISVGVIFGVVVSTLITLFSPTDRVRDTLTLSLPHPEVWASVLGAVVGGMISAFVAQQTFEKATARELARDAAEREQLRMVSAYNLLLKLQKALDRVQKAHNYYRTFDTSAVVEIHQVASGGSEMKLIAQVWQPLQGKRKEINLGIEEQAFLLSEGVVSLLNLIADIEGALSNCEFIEKKYLEFFEGFSENHLASGEYRVDGKLVQSSGAADELGLLKATDALEKLRAALTTTLPLLYEAIGQTSTFIEHRFGKKIEMQFDKAISGVASYA